MAKKKKKPAQTIAQLITSLSPVVQIMISDHAALGWCPDVCPSNQLWCKCLLEDSVSLTPFLCNSNS